MAYLVLDLGPGIPHLQEDRLQEPVPDVEGQRDQYAGYAHHICPENITHDLVG